MRTHARHVKGREKVVTMHEVIYAELATKEAQDWHEIYMLEREWSALLLAALQKAVNVWQNYRIDSDADTRSALAECEDLIARSSGKLSHTTKESPPCDPSL